MAKDQAEVTKDQSELRTQAISDYTSSGTTNQVTQMFSSNPNTTGIRDRVLLHRHRQRDHHHRQPAHGTGQLQATQRPLQQQQTRRPPPRQPAASENQATALASQDQPTLNSVNANIQNLVAQTAGCAAAAAAAAATASAQRQAGRRPAGPGSRRAEPGPARGGDGGGAGGAGAPRCRTGPAPGGRRSRGRTGGRE